jgi:streptogramin lyase
VVYVGAPLAVLVIVAAVLIAVRGGGGDDDGGGAGSSTAVDTAALSATGAPEPTTIPGDSTGSAVVPTSEATAGPSAAIEGLSGGRRLPVGTGPDGVALDAAGRLWVAAPFGNQVTRVDPDTGRQQAVSFAAGSEPLAVATSEDAVYVTLRGIGRVARIDLETLAVDQLAVAPAPAFLAWGAGSLWSVADGTGIDRIDPDSFTVTANIPVSGAKGVAIVGDAAWVTAGTSGDVVKVDLATNQVVARFSVGTNPDAIVADGDAVWITNRGEGTIVRFDTVSQLVTDRVATGAAPAGIAIDGDRVWVIDAGEGTLTLVDRVAATVVQSVAVGSRPLGLRPMNDSVWVTVSDENVLAQVEVSVGPETAPRVEITGVETVDGRYIPTFTTQNFTPSFAGDLHLHLYWNVTPVVEAGEPGAGPWLMWDQPERVDDEFFAVVNRPAGANAICVVIATSDHQLADVDGDGAADRDTGNCAQLPVAAD